MELGNDQDHLEHRQELSEIPHQVAADPRTNSEMC
jgi:hypothetical protein